MNTRRPTCLRCLRPPRTCFCSLVVPVANQVPVRLLQHPLEADQAKGSARLLGLCLQRFDCQVGEHFAPQALSDWLSRSLDHALSDAMSSMDGTVLLYPDTHNGAPLWPAGASHRPRQLLVIDATWRKSRKMLALNPLLATLPRLALAPQALNRYANLRKAQQPGQLSTLEATALALGELESAPARYAPLLTALEGFVALQGAWRA